MTDTSRYAIYLAPEDGSLLARFVAGIIGYDAHSGCDVSHFGTTSLPAADWLALTSDPRRYGAHATLKAPFRLRDGTTRDKLVTDIDAFAGQWKAFDIGPLAVSCISRQEVGGFIALTNPHYSKALHDLEVDAVTRFEPFRAPLTPGEIARRKPDQLTDRQKKHLADFGYPFVKEDFAFHITLTNQLQKPESIADMLADRMAQDIGTVWFRVDALYLFEQPDPAARFRITGRFPLAT